MWLTRENRSRIRAFQKLTNHALKSERVTPNSNKINVNLDYAPHMVLCRGPGKGMTSPFKDLCPQNLCPHSPILKNICPHFENTCPHSASTEKPMSAKPMSALRNTYVRKIVRTLSATVRMQPWDQVASLGNVFQKGAAKQVQNLTPEPADTIP